MPDKRLRYQDLIAPNGRPSVNARRGERFRSRVAY